jgi:curli biogenesis system outer membrane secretion channel CsgG
MKNKNRKRTYVVYITLFIIISMLSACATVARIDPTTFVTDTAEQETIPVVCKGAYEAAAFKVAVANFTNNTTFEYAKVVQASVQGSSERTAVGAAGVGVAPGAVGVVWGEKEKMKFQQDSQRIEREFNAKLGESVEDGVTNEIVNMGGAKIYTRTEMKKVLDEHKFQMSGLVDENTLVQIGKLAGVKYMVTGSVNNVNLSYKTYEMIKKGLSEHLGLLGTALAAGAESQEGWNLETDIALRIIDVETGEILFSKIVHGKYIIGRTPYPNYDALIGGIKQAASKALIDARPELSRWFTVKGYIIQTRKSPDGKQRAALINVGEKSGLKPGSELIAYTFQEVKDPFTGKSSCDVVRLPVTLKVTDQLQADKAWIIIEGDPNQVKRVKVGQLVERAPMKGQKFYQKMGY